MAVLNIAKEKVDCLAAVLFIVGLGLLAYFQFHHLPAGIAASLGVALIVRQFLLARIPDVIAALVVFGGLFIVFYWNLAVEQSAALLLVAGSIYYIAIQVSGYRRRRFLERADRASSEEASMTLDKDEEH